MDTKTTSVPLDWRTSGGEVFAFSGWHNNGVPFQYSFVPVSGGRWVNRSTAELRDDGDDAVYDTLEAAKAWAQGVEDAARVALASEARRDGAATEVVLCHAHGMCHAKGCATCDADIDMLTALRPPDGAEIATETTTDTTEA